MHLGPGRLPDRGAAPLPYTPQRFRCGPRYGEGHPQLFDAARYPALSAHAARCEALPPFREIVQPLAPPSGD